MDKKLYIKVSDDEYNYGSYYLEKEQIYENTQSAKKLKVNIVLKIDSTFVHYLIKELFLSDFYRTCFIKYWALNSCITLNLILQTTKYNLIDYNWNEKVNQQVRERCELDHALSWLSTLGGAFSALGDYFPNCADTAGKISFHQLQLAVRLGDPNIAARCRLYLSLSLIQKKRYRLAQRIISREYRIAKSAAILDQRLLNMCKGIWSKLQYEHDVFKRDASCLVIEYELFNGDILIFVK